MKHMKIKKINLVFITKIYYYNISIILLAVLSGFAQEKMNEYKCSVLFWLSIPESTSMYMLVYLHHEGYEKCKQCIFLTRSYGSAEIVFKNSL